MNQQYNAFEANVTLYYAPGVDLGIEYQQDEIDFGIFQKKDGSMWVDVSQKEALALSESQPNADVRITARLNDKFISKPNSLLIIECESRFDKDGHLIVEPIPAPSLATITGAEMYRKYLDENGYATMGNDTIEAMDAAFAMGWNEAKSTIAALVTFDKYGTNATKAIRAHDDACDGILEMIDKMD